MIRTRMEIEAEQRRYQDIPVDKKAANIIAANKRVALL